MTSPASRSRGLSRSILLVALGIALAGCSGSGGDAPEVRQAAAGGVADAPTSADDGTAASAAEDDIDAQFVAWVRMNGIDDDVLSDDLVLATAHDTCESLDAGDSYASVIDALADVEVSEDGRVELVRMPVAAISIFCPQHVDKVE